MDKLPRGVEKVIALAALDAEFKQKLLADREKALSECDIKLTDTEAGLLRSIPEKQLAAAIDNTRVPSKARRLFLIGGVAAALTIVIGAIVIPSQVQSLGHQPGHPARAIGNLNAISKAQVMYHSEHNTYGTLAQLAEAGYIEDQLGKGKKGYYTYTFTKVPDKDSWEITATTTKKDGMSFKMAQDAVLWRNTKHDGTGEWIRE